MTMPRRRALLAADVRQALERLRREADYAPPALPPEAMDRLRGLTHMVNGLLGELATGKTLWHLEPTARTLVDLTRRVETASTPDAARSALEDLLGVLTDESRWR